jgi:ketosteroid isomerase-like protein
MKYLINVFFLSLLFFLPSTANAQNEAAVATVVDKLYSAMIAKDKSVLIDLTSEKLTYGHSSDTLEDKEQFIDAVMNGSFDYVSITAKNQEIIISGDVALVRHIFMTNALNNGAPVDVSIGNLMTFQKQNDEWKLLARQAYKL